MFKFDYSKKATMLLACAAMLRKYYKEVLVSVKDKHYGHCWSLSPEDKEAYVKPDGFYNQMNKIGIADSTATHGARNNSNFGIGTDGAFIRFEYFNVLYRIYFYLFNMLQAQFGIQDFMNLTPVYRAMCLLSNYLELVANRGAGDAYVHKLDEEDLALWADLYDELCLLGVICDEESQPWLVQKDGTFNGAQLMNTLYRGYEVIFSSANVEIPQHV